MTAAALKIIHDEHAALAVMLRTMSVLLAACRKHGAPPDFALFRAMLFYVDEFPERLHHTKESALLFPLLRERAPALGSVLDRLDQDHARGGRAIRDLEHALRDIPDVAGPLTHSPPRHCTRQHRCRRARRARERQMVRVPHARGRRLRRNHRARQRAAPLRASAENPRHRARRGLRLRRYK